MPRLLHSGPVCAANQSSGGARAAASVLLYFILMAPSLRAQDSTNDTPDAPQPSAGPATFFEHSNTARWWISGQANFVFQAHGDFYAAYSGTNSLKNTAEHATSRVLTFFSGYEFT